MSAMGSLLASVSASRVLALAVLLLVPAGQAAAQGPGPAGLLRFRGSGSLGTGVDAVVLGGPGAVPFALLLAPEVGSVVLPFFASDCLSVRGGLFVIDLPLNGRGAAQARIDLPLDTRLQGVYLAAQGVAGTPGLPGTNCASFVAVGAPAAAELVETFDGGLGHDPDLGAVAWPSDVVGVIRPGTFGGSARLGSFDPAHGTLRDGAYVFRTDGQTFPASATLTGAPIRVRDGLFEFLDFVVPAGVTVRFEGDVPARILVTGAVRIDGVLDCGGLSQPIASGAVGETMGQAGGIPGPGGGAGGAGGDLASVPEGSVDGRPGGDARALPGAALDGLLSGTGGAGSSAWPLAADPLAVRYDFLGLFSNQFAGGGGGGGGARLSGAPGTTLATRAPGAGVGPHAGGGGHWLTASSIADPRIDLLIGGSGGGGSGVHAYDSVVPSPRFVPGSGGGGGGGAVLIACAGDFAVGPQGELHADGGDGAARTDADGLLRAPAGGGGGGTVLLQVRGSFSNQGRIGALGGAGGRAEDLRLTPGTAVAAGDGAPGRVILEVPGPLPAPGALGLIEPAPLGQDIRVLNSVDLQSVAASTWFALPPGADPALLAYEVYTVQDALSVRYTDLGGGAGPVRAGATPVVLFTRFAELDAAGAVLSTSPWRVGSAVAMPGANAVQFVLRFDRGLSGQPSDLRVEAVRLKF